MHEHRHNSHVFQAERADELTWYFSMMTAGFRCASCGAWHDELPLALGYDEPIYVAELDADARAATVTDLDGFCELRRSDGQTHRFICGVIELPIIGTTDVFRYGVWATLGEASFQAARVALEGAAAAGPFFGWVSNHIDGYPDTLNLKSHVYLRAEAPPSIELEPTDHPLAVEPREGITLDRVHQIAERALHPEA